MNRFYHSWRLPLLWLAFLPLSPCFAQLVAPPDQTAAPSPTQGSTHGPIECWYGYERYQNIYLANEMPGTQGSGGSIQKIAYYVGTAGTSPTPIKIYLLQSSAGTVSQTSWANVISAATQVYTGTVTPNAVGWFEITLGSSFTYDGTSNVQVLIESNYGGGGGSSFPAFAYQTTSGNRNQYWRQDNSAPGGNGTVNAFVNNVRFVGTGQFATAGCTGTPTAGATVGTQTFCAAQSFTLTVTGSSTGVAYTYQWQTETSFGSGTYVDISGATGATYTTPALSASGRYQRVIKCTSSGLTAASTPAVLTFSPVTTYPYTLTFDGSLCGVQVVDVNADGKTWVVTAATFSGSSSPNVMQYSYSTPNAANDWFFTPALTVNGTSAYTPTLQYAVSSSGNPESFEIWWGTTPTPAGMTTQLYSSGLVSNQSGLTTPNTVTFTPPAGFAYIGVKATSPKDRFNLLVDNLTITQSAGCSGTPNTPTVSDVATCTGSTATFTASGYSSGGGISYQWETYNGSAWVNVSGGSGANTIAYTTGAVSAAAQYRLRTTCANGGASSVSATANLTINPFYACYCSTNIHTNTCTGPNVTNVTIASTTLNNTSTCSNVAGNSYSKFGTSPSSVTATLQRGVTYTLSATTDGSAIDAVWVDFDQNGTFDASEYFLISGSASAGVASSTSIIIPAGAVLGVTGLRVRSRATGGSNASGDACTSFNNGETEDYQVTIAPAPGCSGTPSGGTLPAFTYGCNGNGTFSPTGVTGSISGISYQWQQYNGSAWVNATGTGTTTATLLISGVSTQTQYRLQVTCANGGAVAYSTASTFIPLSYYIFTDPAPYVQLFDAAWLSRCDNADAPDQYTTTNPVTGIASWRRQDQGSTANWAHPEYGVVTPTQGTGAAVFHSSWNNTGVQGSMDIHLNLAGASGPTRIRFKYINPSGSDKLSILESNDGGSTFTSPTAGNTITTANAWTSENFTIASTSATTVIRLIATPDYGNDDIALDSLIVESIPNCPVPVISPASPVTATTATLNWVQSAVGLGYQVRYKKTSDPTSVSTWATPANITGTATHSLAVSSLVAATQYEFQVQLHCSSPSFSGWTASQNFTTAPANDDCSGAIALTVGSCGTPITGTVANATLSLAGINCGGNTGNADDDVWYKFVATSANMIVQANPTNSGGDFDLVLDIRSGACNGVNIGCADANGNGRQESTTLTGLSVGATYFVRIYSYGGSAVSSPTFTICVSVPSPPANDNCSGAVALTQSGTATCGGATAGNSNFGTQSLIECSPGTNADDDVWYKFVANASGSATVTVVGGSTYNPVFEIFSGTCGSLSSLLCQNADASDGGTESNSIAGLTPGATYYVRVYNADVGAGNSFTICITTPPANTQDNCNTAVTLSVAGVCNTTNFNTLGATESQAAIACNGNTGNADDDVWFKFTVGASGIYNVKVASASGFDAVIEALSGNCLSPVSLGCADGTLSGGDENLQLSFTAGTYYLRVYNFGAGPGTTANSTICITNVASPHPPANDDITGATPLTVSGLCNASISITANATRSVKDSPEPGTADDDVWFRFTAPATGRVHVTVQGETGMDPAFQIVQADVANKNVTVFPSSTFNATGVNGVEDEQFAGLTGGQTYLLRVWHAPVGSAGDFTVCLTSVPPPSNDECTGAINLTQVLSTSCTPTAGTSVAAGQSLPASTCGGLPDDDVWYKFIAQTTNPTIQVTGVNTFDPVLELRSGTCASSAALGCANATGAGNVESIPSSGLTIGQTYFIRIYGVGSADADQGTFNVCVFGPPPPPANDIICNAVSLPVGVGGYALNSATNLGATNGTEANPSCVPSWNSDVWYKAVVPASGQLAVRAVAGTLTDAVVQVFISSNNTCGGTLTDIGCDDNGNNELGSDFMPYLHLTGLTPGATLFIRVMGYLTDGQGTFSIGLSEGNVWTGGQSTAFSNTFNWLTGNVPASGQNLIIAQSARTPALSAPFSAGKVYLAAGMGMDLAANNLTLAGDLQAAGASAITGTSGKLIFGGATGQTVSGTISVPAINITNTSASGITVVAGASIKALPTAGGATGLVTLAAGAKLSVNAAADFILASNASGTAALGALPTGAQFVGKLTMQRYVSGASRWLFLGAPLSDAQLADWEELQPTLSPLNNASLFWYRETDSTRTTVNGTVAERYGWQVPSTLSGLVNFDKVRGYRVYARSNFFTGSVNATVSAKGTPYTGAVTVPLTKTTNQYYDGGWNLLANPYPSQIDWNSASITKPAGLNNAVFVWNGAANNYQTYVGSGGNALGIGVNGALQYIPSSQAFYVRTSAAGNLVFNEGAKTTAASSFLREGAESNVLRITLHTTANTDEIAVRFADYGSEANQPDVDAEKFWHAGAGVASLTPNGDALAINTLPKPLATTYVPLEVRASEGDQELSFTGMDGLDPGLTCYLVDLQLGRLHDVRNGNYAFSVSADTASLGRARFRLVFSQATALLPMQGKKAGLSVWPNPSTERQAISVQGHNLGAGVATVQLIDVLGQTVYKAEATLINGDLAHVIEARHLPAGSYSVRIVSATTTLVQALIRR